MGSDAHYSNLGFDRNVIDVYFFSLSGGHIIGGRRSATYRMLMLEIVRRRFDVVFLHLGENDIRRFCSSADVARNLYEFAVEARLHTRLVYIGQLLSFPPLGRPSQELHPVLSVNARVKLMLRNHGSIVYWCHRGGFWNGTAAFDREGVHLSASGQRAYWQSVHSAICNAQRALLQ